MRASLAIAVAAVSCMAGCSGDDNPTATSSSSGVPGCKLEFVGDEAAPIEMAITAMGPSLVAEEIADGADVPMVLPVQGGKIIPIGVRATNIDPCELSLNGSLRDAVSGQVRVDDRVINLREDGSGWASSTDGDLASFANIPACPNQWATTDVYANSFELVVVLTDRTGKTAEQTMQVVPFCAEPEFEDQCMCECQEGYMLGQGC